MSQPRHPYQNKVIDPKHEILVVGYPKSGNTWVSRLIGEYLDSPVVGYGNAVPIATEGTDRRGKYAVRQLHLHPVREDGDTFLLNGWQANLNAWRGEKVVCVIRDPRDVAVSVMHYWELPTINDAIRAMGEGTAPLNVVGKWSDFVESWLDCGLGKVWISYEYLRTDQALTFYRLLSSLGLSDSYDKHVVAAYRKQLIDVKREELRQDGDQRPYGKEVQVKNLRKGIVGDHENYFTEESYDLARLYFGRVAERMLYKL